MSRWGGVRAARDPVFADHAQRAEAFMGRIVMVAEGEGMARIQPADLRSAAFYRTF